MIRLALLLFFLGGGGESVEPFTAPGLDGKPVSLLGEGTPPKAIVIAFSAIRCPVATVQAPRLGEIAAAYGPKGVRFLLVDPNPGDDAAAIAERAKESGISFPIVRDAEQELADRLGVSRTTEVILLGPDRKIRYRGALDDQYSVGTRKPAPKRRYLTEALDALLAGSDVAVPRTAPQGCLITRAKTPEAAAPAVTFHRDVAPILRARCAECHRPGEIGPMPLLTYDDARDVSRMIGEVVEQRRMPPWHADSKIGKWSNDRTLPETERKALLTWVAAGAPEGPKSAKPLPEIPAVGRWHIGEPDLVLRAPKQSVPAQGTIEYRYLEVPTDLTEDRWVDAAEVRAGNRAVVHHILVFCVYPKARKNEQPLIDGGLNGGYFASLVPGERPNEWPEGTGKLVPAGSKLMFQIHYAANGTAQEDVSEIGLRFAKKKPEHAVVTRGVFNKKLRIEPGDPASTFEASLTLPRPIRILSFMPHMHYRGKSFRYVATVPGEAPRVLLEVPRYDFNWQATYRCVEPIELPLGTTIRCTAVFDNSAANPSNPDPSALVRFGEQTWDEMLIGYVDYEEIVR